MYIEKQYVQSPASQSLKLFEPLLYIQSDSPAANQFVESGKKMLGVRLGEHGG
jgi:hypothetical protein